jgi:hypothetical protein
MLVFSTNRACEVYTIVEIIKLVQTWSCGDGVS